MTMNARERKRPSASELIVLLAEAGYDVHQAHPECYRNFSYTTFVNRLLSYGENGRGEN